MENIEKITVPTSKKKKRRISKMQVFLHLWLIALSAFVIIPFLLVVSISLSNERDIVFYGFRLIPLTFDLSAYRHIFQNPDAIFQAYRVTMTFSIAVMVFGTLLMSLLAYPLSLRYFKGKNAISFFIFFTMLFSGGLIPTFILYTRYLNLGDTIWVYILPFLINPFFVFMIRTFFKQIPEEIRESAIVDGASEYRYFFTILLPLATPVMAAVALFTFLGRWNEWFTSMIYIDNRDLDSLQYLLRRMLDNARILQDATLRMRGITIPQERIPTQTIQMAMAVVTAGPALVVFPFFQRYFVKGLTVGSVKG